jgi:hypothetical protein
MQYLDKNTCNICVKHMQHPDKTLATCVWNICNIQIRHLLQHTFETEETFAKIYHMWQLQHTSETLEIYICNIGEGKAGTVRRGGIWRRAAAREHHHYSPHLWVPLARPGKIWGAKTRAPQWPWQGQLCAQQRWATDEQRGSEWCRWLGCRWAALGARRAVWLAMGGKAEKEHAYMCLARIYLTCSCGGEHGIGLGPLLSEVEDKLIVSRWYPRSSPHGWKARPRWCWRGGSRWRQTQGEMRRRTVRHGGDSWGHQL